MFCTKNDLEAVVISDIKSLISKLGHVYICQSFVLVPMNGFNSKGLTFNLVEASGVNVGTQQLPTADEHIVHVAF